jgi:SNF2 family DNA or RNA helicase
MTVELIDSRMEIFEKYLIRGKLTPHEYQKDGVRWILSNELRKDPVCNVRGGFIADEMGLGKTIMMIGTMLANFVERTLIIVPLALIDQWYVQIARTTGHKALIFHGNNKKYITSELLESAKIVITTYGAVTLIKKKRTKLSLLHKIVWSRLIFDEAHHLRNAGTSLYFGANLLRSNIRWLVSGTPIQNRKEDFYNLCRMIRLPTSFYNESENLITLTRAFIMKRTKKQVGIIIPDILQTKNMVVWANKKEKELSEELHSALLFTNVRGKQKGLPFNGILAALLKCKQSCILPRLISNSTEYKEYKDAFTCSSKLDNVIQNILKRKDNGCGKLIFCNFREEIDEIERRLIREGFSSVVTFDGRTNDGLRKKILSEKYEVMILQIQTGCEGLNLQEHYSEVYFISPNWNPSVEDQAIARCHRIGQTKVVYVERFEMCEFTDKYEDEDEDEDEEDETVNIENYTYRTQYNKREVAKEYIK